MSTRRLFIGIMAGNLVQRELIQHQAAWKWPAGSRLTSPSMFHLTLQFLGDVGATEEARLVDEIAAIRLRPFDMVLADPGFFPGGIAWVAPLRSPTLTRLHQAVQEAVRRAGIEASEEWTPHVTLARHAAGAVPSRHPLPITWPVERFSLVASKDGRYTEVHAWPHLLH